MAEYSPAIRAVVFGPGVKRINVEAQSKRTKDASIWKSGNTKSWLAFFCCASRAPPIRPLSLLQLPSHAVGRSRGGFHAPIEVVRIGTDKVDSAMRADDFRPELF